MTSCLKRGMWIFAVFVLLVDIVSKSYAYHYLAPMQGSWASYPYGGVGVFHDFLGIDFALTYVSNTGAAWGLLSHFPHILVVARIGIVLGLVLYLFRAPLSVYKRLAVLCIVVGALGNILDFFLYGFVVDFFLLDFWGYMFPVFNVADASISCGVVLLIFSSVSKKKEI